MRKGILVFWLAVVLVVFFVGFGAAVAAMPLPLNLIGFAILIVVAVAIAMDAVNRIPRNYYGYKYLLGRAETTTKVVEYQHPADPSGQLRSETHTVSLYAQEGVVLKLPILESFRCYSFKRMNVPISVTAQSNETVGLSPAEAAQLLDSLDMLLRGQAQWVVDPELLHIFRTHTAETVTEGIQNAIKEAVQVLSGYMRAADFIPRKEEIILLANCILRLKFVPHEYGYIYERRDPVVGPDAPGYDLDNPIVPPEKRLDFYKKHRQRIIQELSRERHEWRRSEVEEKYGIDILEFRLADVDFPPDVKRALEARRKAAGEAEGAKVRHAQVVEMAGELAQIPAHAVSAAQVNIGIADKNIVAVEGFDLPGLGTTLAVVLERWLQRGR